jgi:RHS repeat-associated protein
VRYVRDYLNGSTSNVGNHWVEIEVWGTATTVYVGGIYEKNLNSGEQTSYYLAAGQRVAMRQGSNLLYFAADHLGSTSLTLDASGTKIGEVKYLPFGEMRYAWGGTPTDRRFTGQREENGLGSLYDYGARFYIPGIMRFISADTIVPDPKNPQTLNRYAYSLNNPVKYIDPSGHTVKSALDLIWQHHEDIKSIAQEYNLDPMLLAGVVFAENRNDHNLIQGQDWTSVFAPFGLGGPELKNIFGPLGNTNVSLGITEVSAAVAAMMDRPDLVPIDYGEMSWDERKTLHEQIASNLSADERQRILSNLTDPKMSLEYSAKYLSFLASYRDYGSDYALWLSDYNRGLSDWDTTSEYGRRIDVYHQSIDYALNKRESEFPICFGTLGCGKYMERLLYGVLP